MFATNIISPLGDQSILLGRLLPRACSDLTSISAMSIILTDPVLILSPSVVAPNTGHQEKSRCEKLHDQDQIRWIISRLVALCNSTNVS